jgi:hypothetical protein
MTGKALFYRKGLTRSASKCGAKAHELLAFLWNIDFSTVDQLLWCLKQDLDFSALKLVLRVALNLFPFIVELQETSDTIPRYEWAEYASFSNERVLDPQE